MAFDRPDWEEKEENTEKTEQTDIFPKVRGIRKLYEKIITDGRVRRRRRGLIAWILRRNRRYNSRFAPVTGYIGFQNGGGKADEMRYGIFRMHFNGCEVIAVYNLLRFLGFDKDIREIAEELERSGLMMLGGFGTRPDAMQVYLQETLREADSGTGWNSGTGRDSEEVTGNSRDADAKSRAMSVRLYASDDAPEYDRLLRTSGAGILTFWNGVRKWTIHTVMAYRTENGGIRVYNQYTNVLYNEYGSVDEFLLHEGEPYVPIALITATDKEAAE